MRATRDRIAAETEALRASAAEHDDATLLSHHVIAVQRTRLTDLDGFRREIATGLTGDKPEEPPGP